MAAAGVSAPSSYHSGGGVGIAGVSSEGHEAWSDFPAWLAARGVGARAARALDSALGIGDYPALRACAEHAGLRAELIATARDRLPFGCYAVLRRLVESFELACAGDPAGESGVAGSRGSSLLDILVVLLTALSGELSRSALRLSALDAVAASVASTAAASNGSVSAEPRAGALIQAADGSYLSDHEGMDEDQEELPLADDQQEFPGIPAENHGCDGIPGMHSGFFPGRECNDERGRHAGCAGLRASSPFEEDAEEPGAASHAVKVEMDDLHPDDVKDEDVGAVGHRDGARRPGQWSQGGFVHEGGGGGDVDGGRQRWCHDDGTPGVWDSRWRHHHHHQQQHQQHVQDGSPLDAYSAAPSSSSSCSTAAAATTATSHALATSLNNAAPDGAAATSVRGSSGGTFVGWRGNGAQRPGRDRGDVDDNGDDDDDGAAAVAAATAAPPSRAAPPHRPFVCTSCGKTFSKLAVLTLHVRTHTGERPYVCAQCGRAFAQASSLGYHRRTHTGEKPYACDGCAFRCARSSSLIRHQRACRRRNGGAGDDGGMGGGADDGGFGGGIGAGLGGGIGGVLRY